MKANPVKLKSLIDKWQDVLRLRDWDVELEMMPKEWRKSGDFRARPDDKKAILMINEEPLSENLEELVVHELIHVKLYGMDQMIEELLNTLYGEDEDDPKREFAYGKFMLELEQTVEDLTKGYLQADSNDVDLSFGSIRRQVEEEKKKISNPTAFDRSS